MGVLDGKIAIVTGAGQGVGRGIALAMAKEGAAVAVVELKKETAISTANEIKEFGYRSVPITCDVSKREEVNAAVATVIKEFGAINILVNNAQYTGPSISVEDTTDEVMALYFKSGLGGTLYFMQACFPYMKDKGGKIINLGSAAGTEGLLGFAAYGSNKAAIQCLTKVVAREWGIYKINANTICPFAASPGWIGYAQLFPERAQGALAQVPLGRVGDCEKDIGPVVVFLASPASEFITGMTIMVDGGQTIIR